MADIKLITMYNQYTANSIQGDLVRGFFLHQIGSQTLLVAEVSCNCVPDINLKAIDTVGLLVMCLSDFGASLFCPLTG